MREFLETLPKSLFRTKGVFQNEDGTWFSYNSVGKKIDIVPILTEHSFSENILVFIGVRADGLRGVVEEKLLK